MFLSFKSDLFDVVHLLFLDVYAYVLFFFFSSFLPFFFCFSVPDSFNFQLLLWVCVHVSLLLFFHLIIFYVSGTHDRFSIIYSFRNHLSYFLIRFEGILRFHLIFLESWSFHWKNTSVNLCREQKSIHFEERKKNQKLFAMNIKLVKIGMQNFMSFICISNHFWFFFTAAIDVMMMEIFHMTFWVAIEWNYRKIFLIILYSSICAPTLLF